MVDSLKATVPTQDQINVTVRPDGVIKAGLAAPTEVIKVNVVAVGPGGSSGIDTVARQKADQAQSTATSVQIDLQAHKVASEPHPSYDQDIPDLSLIFKNGLI